MARQSMLLMDNKSNVEFLFDISKEIKYFYEVPVIFLTQKDYSDNIFNTMCSMRTALEEGSKTQIIDIIVDFHLQWLHAIKDLEKFSNKLQVLPRQEVYAAITYTIDAMCNRLKYYQRYMLKYRPSLSNDNQANILADFEIIEEMYDDVTQILIKKLKCFRNFDTDDEFKIKVRDATEELISWVDLIHDEFVIQLTKHINGNLIADLTKILRKIVSDLHKSNSPTVQKLLEHLKVMGNDFSTMIRCISVHDLEMNKLIEKINTLDDKISSLAGEPTAAVINLQNKKKYFENRLNFLENSKTALKSFLECNDAQLEHLDNEQICNCKDFYQLRIFNHALPQQERERLVTELCCTWDLAISGEHRHKSIISILSAADMKEEFTDALGSFYIDQHSRKIYKVPDDETLYQPNEHNDLVPLSDDAEHIYFYDECGRYYFDPKTRQRVYKAHETASEYMMDSSGILLKVKEQRKGVTYYYDNYGRYYINCEGKHIYREADSTSEYENDGLGNLVRIRSNLDLLKLCPDDVHVTEDFKYLKNTVGKALRESIADVILHQPADPIKYLSARLMKYRENLELKEKRSKEKEELQIERELRMSEERAATERAATEAIQLAYGGSEASYDSNLMKYAYMQSDYSQAGSSIHKK
ncbi:jg9291 [Pararge aegeria aegeria]|uniref:Jg9291 protein n=1 Tax=Pararge aegeria aegeria TaxID=348720 RepID=A0A8S4SLT9_9NEOP|nr:jg9291 [Pararge aegeria aegeria]